MVYFLFLIWILIENIYSGNFKKHIHELKFFSTNFTDVAGNFSMAFFSHNAIGSLTMPLTK